MSDICCKMTDMRNHKDDKYFCYCVSLESGRRELSHTGRFGSEDAANRDSHWNDYAVDNAGSSDNSDHFDPW